MVQSTSYFELRRTRRRFCQCFRDEPCTELNLEIFANIVNEATNRGIIVSGVRIRDDQYLIDHPRFSARTTRLHMWFVLAHMGLTLQQRHEFGKHRIVVKINEE